MDVFLVKSMETIDPRGMAKFDSRGMIGIIYNGDYQTLLHTKYRSSGSCGFREEDVFFSFSHWKSMETINPRGVAKFDPRGMAGTIYMIVRLSLMRKTIIIS